MHWSLDEQLMLWNQAWVHVLDVRRFKLNEGAALERIVFPASAFLYVNRGSALLELDCASYVAEHAFVLHGGKGTAVVISPLSAELDYYLVLYQAVCPYLEHARLEQRLLEHNPFESLYALTARPNAQLYETVKEMERECRMPSAAGALHVKMLFYQFIYAVLHQWYNGDNAPADRMTGLAHYIRAHYKRTLTLPELADQSGYSMPYLSALFKEKTGLSPMEYLMCVRMERGAQLLLETRFDLSEVAENAGYTDAYYFGRLFKKMTGMTPIQFRKRGQPLRAFLNYPGFILKSSIVEQNDEVYNNHDIDIENDYHHRGGGLRTGAGLVTGSLLRAMLAVEGWGPVAKARGEARETAGLARTFVHELGETSIVGVPTRVAALEWNIVENVLALGMQPVGVADIERMKVWVHLPTPLAPEVEELGLRSSPDMKKLAGLKPDLIVGVKLNMESQYDKYTRIAPTVVYEKYPLEGQVNQYNIMMNSFVQMAAMLDKTNEAKTVLRRLDGLYRQLSAELAAAGLHDRPFVLAMGYSQQDAAMFRLYTRHSTPVSVLENIGMRSGYEPVQFEQYGYTTTTVEALVSVQECNFFHIVQSDDDIIERHMQHDDIWNSLSFVKENRVFALGGDMWPYVGPLSAETLARRAVQAVLQRAGRRENVLSHTYEGSSN